MSVFKRYFQECPLGTDAGTGQLWREPDGLHFDNGDGSSSWIGPPTLLVLRNTDTLTSLNTATLNTSTNAITDPLNTNTVLMFANTAVNTRPSAYTINAAAAQITINEAGVYEGDGLLALFESQVGANARTNIAFAWYLNGTEASPRAQGNYVRDASAHLQSSDSPKFLLQLSAGDVLQLRHERVAGGTGSVRLQGTNNYISIRRLA